MGFRFHQERGPYHCSWIPDSGMTSVSWLRVISLVLSTGAPARSRVLSPNRFAPLPRVLGPSVLASVFRGYGVEAERSRSPSVKRRSFRSEGQGSVVGRGHGRGSAPRLTWAQSLGLRFFIYMTEGSLPVRVTGPGHVQPAPTPPHPHRRTCSTLGCRSRSSSTISLSSLWAASR